MAPANTSRRRAPTIVSTFSPYRDLDVVRIHAGHLDVEGEFVVVLLDVERGAKDPRRGTHAVAPRKVPA